MTLYILLNGEKVKVKFALQEAMKAQKGSRNIRMSTPSLTSALYGDGWLPHALPPGKKNRYPFI
jgi:hypothetical protein